MKTIASLKSPPPAETMPPEVRRTTVRIVRTLGRVIGAAVLLAIASFCGFGFLAAFEPGNGWLWKVGYGAVGSGCLTGAVAILSKLHGQPSGHRNVE
jgi:hypothetical protein